MRLVAAASAAVARTVMPVPAPPSNDSNLTSLTPPAAQADMGHSNADNSSAAQGSIVRYVLPRGIAMTPPIAIQTG